MAVLRNRKNPYDALVAAELERLRRIWERLVERDGAVHPVFVIAYGLDRLERKGRE